MFLLFPCSLGRAPRASELTRGAACSTKAAGETCQSRIVSLEGRTNNVFIYTLNTIGASSMINRNGQSLAAWTDNVNVFPDNIALFRSG